MIERVDPRRNIVVRLPCRLKVQPLLTQVGAVREKTNESATSLAGSSIVQFDGTEINITILEPLRIRAIPLSATPGGDGAPLILDVSAGAFSDLSENLIVDSFNIVLTESPDISPPKFQQIP